LDDQINVEDCETIGPLPPAKKSGTGYVKLTKQASTSPIDQHCLWFGEFLVNLFSILYLGIQQLKEL